MLERKAVYSQAAMLKHDMLVGTVIASWHRLTTRRHLTAVIKTENVRLFLSHERTHFSFSNMCFALSVLPFK